MHPLLDRLFAGFVFLAENPAYLKDGKPKKKGSPKKWMQRQNQQIFMRVIRKPKLRFLVNLKAQCEVSLRKISTMLAKVKPCR